MVYKDALEIARETLRLVEQKLYQDEYALIVEKIVTELKRAYDMGVEDLAWVVEEMADKTSERNLFRDAFRRLGILLEKHSDETVLVVRGYYDVSFYFDEDGSLIDVDSHP